MQVAEQSGYSNWKHGDGTRVVRRALFRGTVFGRTIRGKGVQKKGPHRQGQVAGLHSNSAAIFRRHVASEGGGINAHVSGVY
jgi:hypothetical protein